MFIIIMNTSLLCTLTDVLEELKVPQTGFNVTIHRNSVINYIVLPRNTTTSIETSDCICSILPASDLCYNFSNCSCFNDTAFKDSLLSCGLHDKYQLQFFNLSNDMHAIVVHVFESNRSCLSQNTLLRAISFRNYFKSFKIAIGTMLLLIIAAAFIYYT